MAIPGICFPTDLLSGTFISEFFMGLGIILVLIRTQKGGQVCHEGCAGSGGSRGDEEPARVGTEQESASSTSQGVGSEGRS